MQMNANQQDLRAARVSKRMRGRNVVGISIRAQCCRVRVVSLPIVNRGARDGAPEGISSAYRNRAESRTTTTHATRDVRMNVNRKPSRVGLDMTEPPYRAPISWMKN